MSGFDAYHKWLGIPAAEQPPNHYRLLGISLFEKDRDVLIAALDQRQRFLMQKANGPHGAFAEPLLENLQQARLCLLNRLTKAQYDSGLRQLLEGQAPDEPKRQVANGSPSLKADSAGASPSQTSSSQRSSSQTVGQSAETRSAQKKEQFQFPTDADLGTREERDVKSMWRARHIARSINLVILCLIGSGIWWMQDRGIIPPLPVLLGLNMNEKPSEEGSGDDVARLRNQPQHREVVKDDVTVKRKPTKRPQATDERRFASYGAAVTDFSLSADGRFLATIGGERECRVWNLETGETTARFAGHGGAIHAIAISPNGDQVISSAETLMLWNAATGESIGELSSNRRPVRTVRIHHDSQRAATVGAGAVEIWDIAARKQTQTISGAHPMCGALALSDDGHSLAAATGANADVATLFEANSGKDIRSFAGHKGRITSLALSKSGSSLWTASADQTARRWNTQTGATEAVFAHAQAVALSPDETLLATGGLSGVVSVWDAQTGAALLQLPRQKLRVLDITFLPDSEHLLFAGDSTDDTNQTATIQLWKLPKLDLKLPISQPNAIPLADATPPESSAPPNVESSTNPFAATSQPEQRQSTTTENTSSTSAVSTGTAAEKLATGKWIDLLEMVKVPEHVLRGKWRKDFSTMICEPSWDSRFQVPVGLRGSYELNCEFTRRAGSENIAVIFPVGAVSTSIVLSGWNGAASGLHLIDGREARDIPAAARAGIRPGKLQNGHRYRLEIDVTQNNDNAAVTATLDGKLFVQWKGRVTQLSCPWYNCVTSQHAVAVNVSQSPTDIHKLEVRIKQGSKAFRLGGDWQNPIEQVASVPPKAIASKCLTWNGHQYFITDKALNRPDAQRLASLLNGRLLTISSAEEEAFILKEGRGLAFWLSGWRRTDNYEWHDERNQRLDYFGRWGFGQPNNFADDCFLGIITTSNRDRGWHDWSSNAALHAIIEWGEEYPTKR